MAAFILLYLLVLTAWIGSALVAADRTPPDVFLVALGMHVLTGAMLLWRHRGDLGWTRVVRRLPMVALLAVPPLAPTTFCLLVTGILWRAGLNPQEEDRSGRLLQLARSWRRAGALGVVLGVLWAWLYLSLKEHPRRGADVNLWSNPLVNLTEAPVMPPVYVRVFTAALCGWYVLLMLRSLPALAGAPRAAPEGP